MKHLTNRHVVLGVTGGIAAYKSADLVRRLRDAGAQVRVVMTKAAKSFVAPLTFQALSGNPVHDDLLNTEAEAAMGHIELARWADCILIAPASANVIARLAGGRGDDLLTTLCLATAAPIAIAPAMNQQMWSAAVTQDNCSVLADRSYKIIGPDSGSQACGDVGYGRMLEPESIVEAVAELFSSRLLDGIKLLITAGPTQEAIDPVRYISNHSSGKMGFALARAAVEAGAKVTLIAGPVAAETPDDVERIDVVSANDMHTAVMEHVSQVDIIIGAAAVADFRPDICATDKIPKAEQSLQLKLVKNPDIIAEVAALDAKPFVVGFAAETNDVASKAKAKLAAKGLDLIAANQVGVAEQGFHTDTNALQIFWNKGEANIPLANKLQVAVNLLTIIKEQYDAKSSIKNSG